jgi:Domain of unknown function (DUF4082)
MTVSSVFSQAAPGTSLVSDTSSYTLGMQFSLSEAVPLTGIWWYSHSGAAALPTECVIYAVSGTSQVAGTLNSSPSWSGAAGSGWVKCSYDGSVTLAEGTAYKVCVYYAGGSNWYSSTSGYWSGSSITSGPITAPNAASASGGIQDSFGDGFVYPVDGSTSNYWVDVEVTTPSGTGSVPEEIILSEAF